RVPFLDDGGSAPPGVLSFTPRALEMSARGGAADLPGRLPQIACAIGGGPLDQVHVLLADPFPEYERARRLERGIVIRLRRAIEVGEPTAAPAPTAAA